ncbi:MULTISPECIES: DUF2491 family protein [Cupriavidus]
MGLFDLTRRVIERRLDQAAQRAATPLPRVDTGLPFDARIGGLLELPRARFALLEGSLTSVPAQPQHPIVAVSRVRLDDDADMALYRLYTDCGIDRKGQGQRYLQVLVSGDEILDVAYYQFLCRQIPVTEAEQAPFRGQGFGLGESQYAMADDQLCDIGLSAERRAALLGDAEALEFQRDTPATVDYVTPFTARETRLDDAFGETGLRKTLSFMPYTRALANDGAERLQISFEVVDSMDGRAAPAVYVDFMVGLTLDRQSIKVR